MNAVDELNLLLGIGPKRPTIPPALQRAGYNPVKTLGTGSFGQAFLLFHNTRRKYFVGKHVNMATMTQSQRRDARREIEILRGLDHPNVIKYVESCEDPPHLYILMEYADGGDLYSHLKRVKLTGKNLPEDQVINLLVQVAMAVKYLHDRRVLHRDIKAQNVFLTQNHVVKLGDFGISTVLQSTVAMAKTMCGTPSYFSPELCQGRPYNNKSDIWALGVLTYEMTTHRMPFESHSLKRLMEDIVNVRAPRIPTVYSDDLAALVAQMLEKDPGKRPDVDGVLHHPALLSRVLYIAEQLTEVQGAVIPGARPPAVPSPQRSRAAPLSGPKEAFTKAVPPPPIAAPAEAPKPRIAPVVPSPPPPPPRRAAVPESSPANVESSGPGTPARYDPVLLKPGVLDSVDIEFAEGPEPPAHSPAEGPLEEDFDGVVTEDDLEEVIQSMRGLTHHCDSQAASQASVEFIDSFASGIGANVAELQKKDQRPHVRRSTASLPARVVPEADSPRGNEGASANSSLSTVEEDVPLGGHCLCGSAAFTLWLSDVYGSFTCKCQVCRRVSGALEVVWLHIPEVPFSELIDSSSCVQTYSMGNGCFYFCPRCGSSVAMEHPGFNGCVVPKVALSDVSMELLTAYQHAEPPPPKE